MLNRWVWLLGSVVFAASSCTASPPARSAAPAPGSATPPAAGSPGAGAQGAANAQGLPKELPPAIAKMMEEQPCQPRLRVPLEEHLLKGADGTRGPVFMIGVGEKLCLVGSSSSTLKLVEAPVPLAAQAQKLVSAEFMVLDVGSVLVLHNHFDRTLRYRAVVKIADGRSQPTTVCPIRANLAGVEHWPETLEAVAFGDFVPLETGDRGECR